MRAAIATMTAMAACACLCAADSTTRPSEADRLAAESLRNTAGSLLLQSDAVGRATRIQTDLEFAARLAPDDPRTAMLLADVYRGLNLPDAEAGMLEVYLAANGQDHAAAVRRMMLHRDSLNTAEQRLALFNRIASDDGAPVALRAEAMVQAAMVLVGQGRRAEAVKMLDDALAIDPWNVQARDGRVKLLQEPTPADYAAITLSQLAADPADSGVAVRLADRLQSLGLSDLAVEFFEHALKASDRTDAGTLLAAEGLADALLDSGKPEAAINALRPLLSKNPKTGSIRIKMVEAYRAAGKTADADAIMVELAGIYPSQTLASEASPAFARELAWFYMVAKPDPVRALAAAQQAASRMNQEAPDEQIYLTAVLGAAELLNGDAQVGRERLSAVASGNILAAAFLAESYLKSKDAKEAEIGVKVLRSGLELGRGGWAARRLIALAGEHKIAVPPMRGADGMSALLKPFDRRLLAPGVEPAKHLSVEILPVREAVAPGEPIEIEVRVTNRGAVPITSGPGGLFLPQAAATVTMTVGGKERKLDLPDLAWPAPKRLAPGQTLTARVRVDVGVIAQELAARPLDELTVTVAVVPSPLRDGDKLRTSVPGMPALVDVKIRRASLLERVSQANRSNPAAAYQEAIAWVVNDIQRGDLAARMRAARQAASLLGCARRIEQSDATAAPKDYVGFVKRPVLLRMIVEVLKDRDAAIRAELLDALCDARIDDGIMQHLAATFDDPADLVRLRSAELVGQSQTRGWQTIAEFLARDRNDLVRKMASAFIEPRRPTDR